MATHTDPWESGGRPFLAAVVPRGSVDVIALDGFVAPRDRCTQCGYIPGRRELKNCGACNVAKYCSPECHKANWPFHKTACVPRLPSARALCDDAGAGYSCPAAVAAAMRDWAELNRFAITMACNAAVHLSRGPTETPLERMFAPEFYYSLTLRTPRTEFPAAKFRVETHSFSNHPYDHYKGLRWDRALWGRVQDLRRDAFAAAAAARRNRSHAAAVAGYFPVVLWAESLRQIVFHAYPVYRLRPGADGREPQLSGQDALVLGDVLSLYTYIIGGTDRDPAVVHPPRNSRMGLPIFGRMRPNGKRWIFEHVPDWSWDTNLSPSMKAMLKSGLKVSEIFARFRQIVEIP
ncbi:uncharacterized protein BXZ73DRAFT_103693 [Epithele typhae]|uniref:uncharacterized protein n=1 Tax=Epithele typhae TaxID=378194 RepID=UPI0020087844|nr:uncharacterized protein BXZ73DRAFT_103693 [Epithele typhae]KAH9923960.1 hypothetical protein BXZ73DRAFT_103693 [Epithele typhae]